MCVCVCAFVRSCVRACARACVCVWCSVSRYVCACSREKSQGQIAIIPPTPQNGLRHWCSNMAPLKFVAIIIHDLVMKCWTSNCTGVTVWTDRIDGKPSNHILKPQFSSSYSGIWGKSVCLFFSPFFFHLFCVKKIVFCELLLPY